MKNPAQLLREAPLFLGLSEQSKTALSACCTVREREKGTHLFLDKDIPACIYFLAEGKAALYKLNSLHERKVIFIYGPGNFLNEGCLQRPALSINCELIEDSTVLCFAKDAFLKIMEQDFTLSKAVIDSMSLKIHRLYHQLKNTSNTVRMDKRIAAKLWKLSLDHGIPGPQGYTINIHMTVSYLAELLGSKRETVSRQLKVLTDQGLVLYQKNRFLVPDREKLKKYFQEP
ncbi:MAG: Crp/Fnr family transcriptional regulator [Blautia sp.]|jgi:CRP/FNR family cyclic AMP-dependent transcriptional regulator